MYKSILSIFFATSLLFAIPQKGLAKPFIDIIENNLQEITISVNESVLHVSGANGQTMQIYNVAGVCVMSVKIDSPDKKYDLNFTKGCYIVKIGKTVRKISVR